MTHELEPLKPDDGVSMFLDHKESEVISSTLDSYETSLEFFLEYCALRDIGNLNRITGRDIERYRVWRREESTDGTLETKTMRDQMYLFRDFVRYIESIEAVPRNLSEKVVIPKLGPGDGVRDIQLEAYRARRILAHLEKFAYSSIEHVVWLLLCETGRRIGGLHTLDVGDFRPNAEHPHLAFRHRPEQGTRLKNGVAGETNVNLTESACNVLRDYIEMSRPESQDEFGRQPLLATSHGRLSTSTMRKYVYKWSRPCYVTGDCPHDQRIDTCEAAESTNKASKCPSSKSPHAIRHGYISSMRNIGAPKPFLSERCDVSEAVIEKHYDERDKEERQELRSRILEEIFKNDQPGYAI